MDLDSCNPSLLTWPSIMHRSIKSGKWSLKKSAKIVCAIRALISCLQKLKNTQSVNLSFAYFAYYYMSKK